MGTTNNTRNETYQFDRSDASLLFGACTVVLREDALFLGNTHWSNGPKGDVTRVPDSLTVQKNMHHAAYYVQRGSSGSQSGSLEEHQHHQERERNTDFGDPAPDLPNRLSCLFWQALQGVLLSTSEHHWYRENDKTSVVSHFWGKDIAFWMITETYLYSESVSK